MDAIETIRTRRSIRKFSDRSIDNSVLEEILEDARAAPSAGNLQGRDIIVIRKKETMRSLAWAAWNQTFIIEANVLLVVCANRERAAPYGERGRELYCIQDADAAVMNILLSAHTRGLASVWIGAFDEEKVSTILRLPVHIRPVAMLPVGYPQEDQKEKKSAPGRLSIEEFVHYEEW